MINLFKRLVVEEEGQGLVEYTLIVLLVALVFWVAVKATNIGNQLTGFVGRCFGLSRNSYSLRRFIISKPPFQCELGVESLFHPKLTFCEYNPANRITFVALFKDLHGFSSRFYIVCRHRWCSIF